MKDKTNQDGNINDITKTWSKESWKNLNISQQPEYIDMELVSEVTEKVY
jgi:hypothetical protein